MNGFTVDVQKLGTMEQELSLAADRLEEAIYDDVGEVFNINSTKQLGVVLFEKMGLPVVKKTKTGYSTDSEVLEELKDRHVHPALVAAVILAESKFREDASSKRGANGLMQIMPETGTCCFSIFLATVPMISSPSYPCNSSTEIPKQDKTSLIRENCGLNSSGAGLRVAL